MLEISERHKRFLENEGIRFEKVEKQVKEFIKTLQENEFTLNESLMIAKCLENTLEAARYQQPGILLSDIEFG